jgi:phosphoglycolate phosphatase
MIGAVVFDFDGTLVDTNALKRGAYDTVVRDHPTGAALAALAIARSEPDRRAVFALYAELQRATNGMALDPQTLVDSYARIVDDAAEQAREMPGASALLGELARLGLPCHLSSATLAENLARIVAARGWTAFFASINGRPSGKVETLNRIASEAGLAPDRIAVVGDGEDDLESASRFGARFFPVGEARGTVAGARIFRLDELADAFAGADAAREHT